MIQNTNLKAVAPYPLLKSVIDWLIANGAPSNYAYTEETVWFPGQNYTDYQVTFYGPNGAESYDATLLLKNPEITLIEMRAAGIASGNRFEPVTFPVPVIAPPPAPPVIEAPSDPFGVMGDRIPEDPSNPVERYYVGPAGQSAKMGQTYQVNGRTFVKEKVSPFSPAVWRRVA